MNNLKEIRELFGYSQEEVAKALEVSRVAVSKWENSDTKVSQSNLEKLSLLFGIGPEYIYEKPLDDRAIYKIQRNGKRIRALEKKGNNTKYYQVIKELMEIDVRSLIRDYFLSTKLLLAKAEDIGNDELDDLVEANKKLLNRLQKIQNLRQQDKGNGEDAAFLTDLINKYDTNNVE